MVYFWGSHMFYLVFMKVFINYIRNTTRELSQWYIMDRLALFRVYDLISKELVLMKQAIFSD